MQPCVCLSEKRHAPGRMGGVRGRIVGVWGVICAAVQCSGAAGARHVLLAGLPQALPAERGKRARAPASRLLSKLVCPPVWALLLSCLTPDARADLWGYMDEAGITHFAATQVDEHYKLLARGVDPQRLNLGADSLGLVPAGGESLQPAGASGQQTFRLPSRFMSIDYAIGYKAVRHHIRAAAKAYAVDYALIKAVIAVESGFDARAVSSRGAVGLMQLLPTTAQQYGVGVGEQAQADGQPTAGRRSVDARVVQQRLTHPRTNIFAGARHLAYLIELFGGDIELAVAAYNAGQGVVRRAGNKVPNYRETQNYVKTVMRLYGLFQPAASVLEAAQASTSPPQPVTEVAGRAHECMHAGMLNTRLGGQRTCPLSPASPQQDCRADGRLSEAGLRVSCSRIPSGKADGA